LAAIDDGLQKKRNEKLSPLEKRLALLKAGKGGDQDLGEALLEYGQQVKKLETELAQEKEK
jgi:hypothetical protein